MFLGQDLAQIKLWHCYQYKAIYNLTPSEIIGHPGYNWETDWDPWRKAAVKEFQGLFVMRLVTTS